MIATRAAASYAIVGGEPARVSQVGFRQWRDRGDLVVARPSWDTHAMLAAASVTSSRSRGKESRDGGVGCQEPRRAAQGRRGLEGL